MSEAGTISLGVRLNDTEFLERIEALGKQGADRLQRSFSNIHASSNFSSDLSVLVKDAVKAIDTLSDNVTNSFSALGQNIQNAIANGIGNGAKIGNERLADMVKMPQIKAEYTVQDYENAISRTEEQLDALNAKIYELQNAGGENKALYKMMEQSDQLVVKIRTLENTMGTAKAKAEEASTETKMLSPALSEAGRTGSTAGEQIRSSMGKATESVKNVGSEAGKTSNNFRSLTKMMGYAFGIRSAFMLIRKAVQTANETISQAGSQFPKFGAQVNLLRRQSQQLKSAFGGMFIPLYKAAMPILSAVYNFAIKIFNGIALVMAKLFGQKTALQAVGGITAADVQAANAIDKSAAASKKDAKAKDEQKKKVKELKAELAGFDELNILRFDKQDEESPEDDALDDLGEGVAGGGLGLAQGGLFEEVAVGSSLWEDFYNLVKDTKPWQILEKSAKKAFDEIAKHAEKAGKRISKSWETNSARMLASIQHLGPKMAESFAAMAGYIFMPIIAGATSAGIDVGAALIDGLFTLGADLLELADAAFSPFFDAINGFFERHGEEISGLIYDTWNMIGEGVSGIIDGLVEVYHQVFGGLIDWYKAHSQEIEELWTRTWETIWGFIEPIWREMLAIGKAIFGAFHDYLFEMAPKVREIFVNTWDIIWNLIKPIWEGLLALAKVIFGELQAFWAQWGGAITTFFSVTWEAIKTIFGTALDVIVLILQGVSQIIQGDWEGLWNTVKTLAETIWNGLVTTLDNVIHALSGLFNSFYIDIERIWNDIKGVFQGVIDFITGVFTGNWERAWNGLVDIFRNIWDGMKAIFAAPINWIIDGLNFFIRQLNRIKIPDWVPGVGGKGINIEEIQHIQLARGGVVDQPTLAQIGERGAEAVVPLENNTGWMDKLAEAFASKINANNSNDDAPINVTIPVYLSDGNLLDAIEVAFDRRGRLRNEAVFS